MQHENPGMDSRHRRTQHFDEKKRQKYAVHSLVHRSELCSASLSTIECYRFRHDHTTQSLGTDRIYTIPEHLDSRYWGAPMMLPTSGSEVTM